VTNQTNYKFVENINTSINYLATNPNINIDIKPNDEIYRSSKNNTSKKEDLVSNTNINHIYSIKK
jgi:hypothetical protein